MSKANRKRMYDELVAKGKLSQDDGSLEKEFGAPAPKKAASVEKPKPKLFKKGGK